MVARRRRSTTPEGSLKDTVCDLLEAERIRYHRLNSGVMLVRNPDGSKRAIRLAPTGTADLLMLVPCGTYGQVSAVYVELKAPNGRQSSAQMQFQRDVESEGFTYLLVKDVSQVVACLRKSR